MYYSTFLEQMRCPSQHSGTKMKSAAGAGESWGKKKVSIASSIASDSTHSYTFKPLIGFFHWAVRHELRLPVDTDLHINPLLLPPLNPPQHFSQPNAFNFY